MRLRIAQPKVAVSVVFVLAMFMNILDITIVNVALPAIASDFGETPEAVAAVSVGYLVSLAVFIPASGWLGDRFGGKRVLLFAIAVFTLASALCGLAGSLPELVAARVLQGVGGGLMMPVGMGMLMRTFPPSERIRAAKILTVPTALAPALGPVVGGLLVTNLSWQWVFLLNLPIGAFALAFGATFLREHREPTAGRFDLPGFVLAGTGLASVMFALSEGATRGWTDPAVVGAGLGGVLLLTLLVVVEQRTAEPMLDLALFGNRLFRSCNLAIMGATAAFLGAMFLLPLMLQTASGYSALESGLTTFPTAIGVIVASQIATRLYPQIGPRRLMIGGLFVISGSMAALAFVDGGTSAWLLRVVMFVLGLGMAHLFIPSQTAAFATVPDARAGGASMLFNVQRQIGSAIGVAVISSVLAAVGTFTVGPTGPVPNYTAYHVGFGVAAVMALLGVVAAIFVRDADAASTMVRPDAPATEQRTSGEPVEVG